MAKDDDKKGDGPKPTEPVQPPKPAPAPAPTPANTPTAQVVTPNGANPQHIQVIVQNPVEKPADPIPGFDETVPGGAYYERRGNRNVLVDAHGQEIKKGFSKQDPRVFAKQRAADRDLSRTHENDPDAEAFDEFEGEEDDGR